MKINILAISLLVSLQTVLTRDFYRGIFNKDDYLVAQDNVFKERRPYSYATMEYGRLFKCPVTYFRVVDRLGMGPGPTVKILRGGLLKKYIVVRLRSVYNQPISVNIYVGCENKQPRTPSRPWKTSNTMTETHPSNTNTPNHTNGDAGNATEATDGPGDVTTAAHEAGSTAAGGDGGEGGETEAPAE